MSNYPAYDSAGKFLGDASLGEIDGERVLFVNPPDNRDWCVSAKQVELCLIMAPTLPGHGNSIYYLVR